MSDLLQLVVSGRALPTFTYASACRQVIRIAWHSAPGRRVPSLAPEDTEELMQQHHLGRPYPARARARQGRTFGFAFGELTRFRVSVFKEKGNFGLVLRQIPTKLRLEDIGLPPSVRSCCTSRADFALVTGPTGSGKEMPHSTSMINIINEERDEAHIITIEDPIEFYHKHLKAIVTRSAKSAWTCRVLPKPCATRCARIRTSFSSVKCAIWRPLTPP